MRPAEVRHYFDADVLGLAEVGCALRSDCTFPGDPGGVVERRARPACPVAPATPDSECKPIVAARGWVVLTRDRNITSHPRAIEAVRASRAELVVLSGKDATSP